jgi:hypothetical protein
LGLAYQITGDRRYAEKAREILLAYAEKYDDYPLHTIRGEAKIGGGRVGPQTLDEATWLIPFCQGADLVWETLSEADRKAIAEGVLQRAAREVILPHRMGVHNIQCWKNSAVGLVGFLLGDEELIHEALFNPDRGYERQMKEGVMPDGVWWEGAWGYHFYTLSALWSLTEAARNCGLNLYGEELKRMYDAPLTFAMPNLHLPAFNDSGEVNVRGRVADYELAYARYREPRYVTLLRTSDRRNDFALWFGVGELPEAPPVRWTSANHPRSGYAILARGAGEQATWLCLKYGPHGGGHGHPDKLNFILYARGQVIAPDPGTARYGVPIQGGWYRTTLAHNTLIVDETSQRPAEGRCLAFGRAKEVDFVMAEAGDIYDGVRFVRTVALLNESLLLFVDQIRCDRERWLDVAYHQRGVWEHLPGGEAWTPPRKLGYAYLRDTSVRRTDAGLSLTTRVRDDWRVAFALAGGEPLEVITATGVGAHVEDRVPMVLLRRRARETAFAWCVDLDGRAVQVRWLPVRSAEGRPLPAAHAAAVQVQRGPGEAWILLANPDALAVRVALPDGTAWETKEKVGVR